MTDSADFSQKATQKKTVLALLRKLRPGLSTSIPLKNSHGVRDASFEIAVMEVLKESGGEYAVLEMGDSITVSRTLSFAGKISPEAMEHLETQGRLISAEAAMHRTGFDNLSIPKDDSPFDGPLDGADGLTALPFVPDTET